jgi:hypothetical protein
MAFNFTGTFTSGQKEKLRIFSKYQEQDIRRRIAFLQMKLNQNGFFLDTTFGPNGVPTKIEAAPQNSWAYRLLRAYRMVGGIPEQELLIRTKNQPVYLTEGAPIEDNEDGLTDGHGHIYNNQRRVRENQTFDQIVWEQVEKLKVWQRQAIKGKRENLEYKIYKCLDNADQIREEIALLNSVISASDPTNHIETILADIESAERTPGVATTVNDPKDYFGLNIGKTIDPFVAEDVRESEGVGGRIT